MLVAAMVSDSQSYQRWQKTCNWRWKMKWNWTVVWLKKIGLVIRASGRYRGRLCEWKEGNGCTVTPPHRSVIKTNFQSHSDLYRVGLTWKCAGCTPQQEPLTIVKLMLEGQVERHCLKFGATELAAVCDKLRVRTSCVFSWLSWKVCCARFVSCFFFTFKYVRWHPGNATQLTNIFLQNCWRP